MIDRDARNRLAIGLRRLASGRITNDQFDDSEEYHVVGTRDAGVTAIYWATWMLYDDLHEHKLEGAYALGRFGRKHVARWILFLKSDAEYQWPEMPFGLRLLLFLPNIVTFGLLNTAFHRWRDRRGDADVWPFMRRTELEQAIASWPRA